MTRWGLVSTIKALPRDVLNFAAYHLDLGADHLFIYLDNANPKAEAALAAHPQVTVIRTDGAYWRALMGRKPPKHQLRQTRNATQAYQKAGEIGLDWIGHIDVDEFICPDRPLADTLAALPSDIPAARIAPAEAMAPDDQPGLDRKATYCKAWERDSNRRLTLDAALYPRFGRFIRGGFVSHTQGKSLLRTGLPPFDFRIHRGMRGSEEIGPSAFLDGVDLCHRHIQSWEGWQKSFEYRHAKGSYRPELKSIRPAEEGGLSLHDLFNALLEEGGQDMLRAFFDEICLARPDLLKGLEERGLLRVFHLDLAHKREGTFPGWQQQSA